MFEEWLKTLGATIMSTMAEDEAELGLATYAGLRLRYGWDRLDVAKSDGFDRWSNSTMETVSMPDSIEALDALLKRWTGQAASSSPSPPPPKLPKPRRQDHFGLRLKPALQARLDALLPRIVATAPTCARITRGSLAASLIEEGIERWEAKLAGKDPTS